MCKIWNQCWIQLLNLKRSQAISETNAEFCIYKHIFCNFKMWQSLHYIKNNVKVCILKIIIRGNSSKSFNSNSNSNSRSFNSNSATKSYLQFQFQFHRFQFQIQFQFRNWNWNWRQFQFQAQNWTQPCPWVPLTNIETKRSRNTSVSFDTEVYRA